MNAAMISAHQTYLNSKNELKEAEWALEKATAQLVNELNDNEEIEGVIVWKREENLQVVRQSIRGPSSSRPVCSASRRRKNSDRQVQIDDGRKYP